MKNLLVRDSQGTDVRLLKAALLELLGADGLGFGQLDKDDWLDADAEAAIRRWQAGVGLVADGVMGPFCQTVLGLRKPSTLALELDVESVRRLFPATKPANIARYLPYVAAALEAMGLTDRPMICAALGTIRAESEGFLPISEFQSQFNTLPGGAPFARYEDPKKHLGNTQPGDGARFKGRGFVQLTGRTNYEKYGKAIGVDLAASADLANAPEVAALLLAQFLADHAAAIREALAGGHFADARKLVNGGAHGLERFKDVFKLADAVWPVHEISGAMAPLASGKRGGGGLKALKATRAGQAGKAVVATTGHKRSLTVRKDPTDLNDKSYLPPPVGLQESYSNLH